MCGKMNKTNKRGAFECHSGCHCDLIDIVSQCADRGGGELVPSVKLVVGIIQGSSERSATCDVTMFTQLGAKSLVLLALAVITSFQGGQVKTSLTGLGEMPATTWVG